MNFANIENRLATRWLGRNLVRKDDVGSTNDIAAELARAGALHGTVVLAESQTRGRGRQQRPWVSPPSVNLYLSVVLRLDIPPSAAPALTLALGVAVCDTARKAGVDAQLKWPNDVLAPSGKKLAGILAELRCVGERIEHVIAGIGLNVNLVELPEEISTIATSLRLETGREQDRERVLCDLLSALEEWIDRFVVGGAPAVARAWRARAGMLGRRVSLTVGGEPLAGWARDVDDDGALLLDCDDGRRLRVLAGEVGVTY